MSVSVDSLKLRVSQLEEELENTRNNLYKAAECGNTLLSTNQLLNDKLETLEKEHAEKLEVLEQENYSLKMKLERQQTSARSLHQELEETISQFEQEQAMHQKRLSEVHGKKISELMLCNDDLKAEIGRLNVHNKTYQEKLKKQEEIIYQLREEISSQGSTSMLHNELMDLDKLYNNEKMRCEGLELEMMEKAGELEVAMMEITTLRQKIAGLEEECLERDKIAKEWYDAMQVAKDHSVELAAQLELLKSPEVDGTDHSKTVGNSLFGEVDDRRVDIERKMISMKVKYESLERTHVVTTQQLKKMKAEMSALLCQYSAANADAAQVQRLQRALSQSKSEIQTLAVKLHRMERQQAEAVAVQDIKKYMSAFVDFGDKAEYIHFLEQELEQGKKSHSAATKELDLKRTQLLWESNKLSEAEAKLHQSQQEQAKFKKEQTKLRMKIHEVMEELEQEKTVSKQHEAEKRYLEEQLKSRTRQKHRLNSSPQAETEHNIPKCPPTNENLASEPTSKLLDDATRIAPCKPINILEDLDKEINKQGTGLEGQLSHLRLQIGPMNTSSDHKVQKIKPDDHSAGENHIPPTNVVHVNSKDNVNKCPQQ